MTLDWNWFFSSLSQSAAAIVGIFGAFIITKIFSNQTLFLDKKSKLRDLLIQAQRISDNANSFNVEWYSDNLNRPAYRSFPDFLLEKFPRGESVDLITEELLNSFIKERTFSRYSEVEEIKKKLRATAEEMFNENIKRRLADETIWKAQAESEKNPLGGLYGLGGAFNRIARVAPIPTRSPLVALNDIPWDIMRARNDEFVKNYREAKHHARLASEFLSSIVNNPESPSQISWALALVLFIFFIGVIYPLSFMPAAGAPNLGYSLSLIFQSVASFKGFLLAVISIAFTVIVALFFNTHVRMKYREDDVRKVESLTNVENYCSYFKFLENK
jgi:hypothetical protein